MTSRIQALQNKIDDLFRSQVFLLFTGGALLLVFSGWLWWNHVYGSPRGVFEGMISRNLTTTAVTGRQVTGESNGLKVDKTSRLSFGRQNLVRITASTSAVASGTTVRTETIGTPDQEFNRYVSVTSRSGQSLPDFRGVLNKWAEGAEGSTSFAQTALRPYGFPFGNLTGEDRRRLMERVRNEAIFETDYAVKRGTQAGRPIYTYDVRIQPVAYIGFIKDYAASLGFRELDGVDAAAAQGTPPVRATVSVDVRSHRLTKVEYPDLGYAETYSDYNLDQPVQTPKATVSSQQLQDLVTQLR